MTTQLAPSAGHAAFDVDTAPLERVNAPETFWRGFPRAVREVYAYRELLEQLIRQQLKVKYKDSVLGFFWSLLRPVFLLLVYYVAIGVFLHNGFKLFAVYLFSGLVAWNLFTDVVGGCTGAITGNASLVKKVYFPRELLPLSIVGAALVNFAMQLVVLIIAEVAFGLRLGGHEPWLLPMAFLALLPFMTAVGLMLAAVNVYLRDVQHLIEIVLMFWFWMTPICYGAGKVLHGLSDKHLHWAATVFMLNPMSNITGGFQRAVYGQWAPKGGYPQLFTGNLTLRLSVLFVVSCALVFLAQRLFARAQGNFAQEL